MTTYGTADHAAQVTEGRHPGVQAALAWLAYAHLPAPLQLFSEVFYQAAVDLINRIPTDSPELTTALNTCVEAKDWAVRAGIRSDQGKPGPVPRPATVVDPPRIAAETTTGNPDPTRLYGTVDLPPFGPRPIQDRPQA